MQRQTRGCEQRQYFYSASTSPSVLSWASYAGGNIELQSWGALLERVSSLCLYVEFKGGGEEMCGGVDAPVSVLVVAATSPFSVVPMILISSGAGQRLKHMKSHANRRSRSSHVPVPWIKRLCAQVGVFVALCTASWQAMELSTDAPHEESYAFFIFQQKVSEMGVRLCAREHTPNTHTLTCHKLQGPWLLHC